MASATQGESETVPSILGGGMHCRLIFAMPMTGIRTTRNGYLKAGDTPMRTIFTALRRSAA